MSIPNPTPGEYTIYANLYASPNNQPTKASVDAAVLGEVEGNATLTPNPLRLANGKAGKVTLNWKGWTPGSYIGRVTFDGASDPTFVTVLVTPAGAVVVPPARRTRTPTTVRVTRRWRHGHRTRRTRARR